MPPHRYYPNAHLDQVVEHRSPPLPPPHHHHHHRHPEQQSLDHHVPTSRNKAARLEARDNGAKDAFVCGTYYHGRPAYQPVPVPATYPGQESYRAGPAMASYRDNKLVRHHSVLVPGKRKPSTTSVSQPLPQRDAIRRKPLPQVTAIVTQTEVHEMPADNKQAPLLDSQGSFELDIDGEVSMTVVDGVSSTETSALLHTSKRSSMARDFGHMAALIHSSPSPPLSPVKPQPETIDKEAEDYSYLRRWIAAGPLPSPPPPSTPSASPPSTRATPELAPSNISTPDTSAPASPSTPLVVPSIIVTSPTNNTPPPLHPKPRAYRSAEPVDYEVYVESAYHDPDAFYQEQQRRQRWLRGDEGGEVLRVVSPDVPGWTY